jgi:hypothetical protein
MTQRPDDTRLHGWLDETVGQTPDSVEGTRQVMSQVEETSQVGRWLPFPVLHRKAKVKPPTTNHTTEYRPSPISANNGHTPTVIGRTQTMLSPVKAVTAGALVFAIGGVLLIAQPFDQQNSVPGAEQGAEPAPLVRATITVTEGTGAEDEGCTDGPGNSPDICTWHASSQWSATDPRLSGTATTRATEQWWPDEEGVRSYPLFEAYATEVVNDQGRWVGTGRFTGALGGPLSLTYLTFTGEGEYEGLTAVVVNDPSDSDDDDVWTNVAVIIEGELPPFPEMPTAE